jgi:DNA-binding NtrC family response regulator
LTSELTKGSGRRKDERPKRNPLVLLLLDAYSPYLERLLKLRGYEVCRTDTPEHAVAVCCGNDVRVVVLDQHFLGESDGWSLPQSLRMVRSGISVILLHRGPLPENIQLPEGVDRIVSDTDVQSILQAVKECMQDRARRQSASRLQG